MAEKLLNARLQLKYDTQENWQNSTVILKTGEVALSVISVKQDGTMNFVPCVAMKCGDGVHKYSELDFIYARAADVIEAAKTTEGLTNFVNNLIANGKFATAADLTALTGRVTTAEGEIDNLQTLVGSESVATQIQNAIADLDLANTYDAKGSAAAVQGDLNSYKTTNNAAVKANADALTAIKDGTTIDSFKDVEEALAGKQAAGDYATRTEAQGYANAVLGVEADDSTAKTVYGARKLAEELNTAMDGRVDALETALGEGGSVSTQITAAIDKLDVTDTAVENQFVTEVSETDGKIAVKRAALTAAAIPELAISKITGLQTALDGKQATVVWQNGNYDAATNKAITKSDLDAAVAGLSGAVHFLGVVDSLPGTANNGDIVIMGNKEYVYATSDNAWHELGDETIYAVKGSIKDADIAADAAIAQSKVAGLIDALAAKANAADLGTMAAEEKTDYVLKTEAAGYGDILTKTAAGTTYETKTDATAKLTEAKGYTDAEIQKLDVAKKTVAAGQIFESIEQVDGKIAATLRALVEADIPALSIGKVTGLQDALDAKANDADLAAIAKSGNVNDIIQSAGDYIVFNCGSASVNV